ncbi:hypothetical protein ACFQ1S_35965, partial [Kibdelosporangium lantanae]
VLPGDELPQDAVVVDDEAGTLESAVLGVSVLFVSAYSISSSRASELAEGRAQELAAGNGSQ